MVALSFGLQLLSQHNAMLGRFLKASFMSWSDCLILLAIAAIPMLVLEAVKVARRPQ